ncbi:EAL domain-containing protein [Erythrobacter sp. SG61-1L]|uniref:sensor domain-containing phosphodiesterase n=1 Tax=Erythrobacter sp. SG61-1L TaxID=1603897 RepID=UPI0009EC334C|nr:EAL domain-containing protein [Erythrobacter sp. SG61-1L]
MLKFRNTILEQIAKGSPLKEILDRLCTGAEDFFSSGRCSVVSVDPAGMIHPLAGPSFPDAYINALDGLLIGPDVGSCGSAMYHNRFICVEDIETDSKWSGFKQLALPLGLHACSSMPVRDEAGNAIGALAFYFEEKHVPTKAELHLMEVCAELCALALARQQRILDRERRATIDGLTGLPNRSAFDEALTQLRCELPGTWALFIVDIDNLKVTNDTFGHDVGDALLRAAGQRISETMQPDKVFRTGGDEFTVIIQGQHFLQDLYRTAETLLNAISEPVQHDSHTFLPRATIGGAVLAPTDVMPGTVRRNADFALYHAKETMRGGFVRYWPGIGTRMTYRRDAVRDVINALGDNRIDVRYQPIVRLSTREIVGFEALSCMKNASGRVLPASLFQEAFADARVSAELTKRVLMLVAQDIRSWLDMALPILHVGVNVTSADFYFGNLHEKIDQSFGQFAIPFDHLVIEVTEDAYLGQRDQVVASGIRDLRMRGIKVALDDFGTGFAALTHLLTVPIDILKVDQSFVRKLTPEHPSSAIVKGILQIARDLGIAAIAEGVETPEQIEMLTDMGCADAQGFIFSRPISRAKATELLRRHGLGSPGRTPLSLRDHEQNTDTPLTRRVA